MSPLKGIVAFEASCRSSGASVPEGVECWEFFPATLELISMVLPTPVQGQARASPPEACMVG